MRWGGLGPEACENSTIPKIANALTVFANVFPSLNHADLATGLLADS